MNILFLTSRPPYPVSGDRVRVRQQLAWLARRHDVRVLTFAKCDVEMTQVDELRREGVSIDVLSVSRPGAVAGLLAASAASRPLQTGYFESSAMRRALEFAAKDLDVLYVHLVRMAQYWRADAPYAQVLDMCDALSVQYAERAQMRAVGDRAWRFIDGLESRRLARWERSVLEKFDAVSIISDADGRCMHAGALTPHVVPLHVQDCLDYPSAPPSPGEGVDILFPGEMSTAYSRSAARFLALDVMPRVWRVHSDARLTIAGANPTSDVVALKGPRVAVTGYVDDLRPYIERATVVACPIRIGTGLKTKVLQAMALQTPVVASGAANRGIEAIEGEHIEIADEAEAFGDAVLRLCGDDERRRTQIARARRFVEDRFSESRMGERLEAFLAAGIARATRRRARAERQVEGTAL